MPTITRYGLEPFRRRDLPRRLLPFAVVLAAGALTPIGDTDTGFRLPGLVIVAAAVTAASLAAVLLVPWSRAPGWAELMPPLGYLAVVVLLQAATERHLVAFEPMLALPLFWLALYHRRTHLRIGIAAVLGVVLGSVIIQDGSPSSWPEQFFWPVASAALALAVQGLLARIREQRAELEIMARTDPLTGAVNRRTWDEELEHNLALAGRLGHHLQIAMLDLDGFKMWNDQHGHGAGDRLLIELVRRWSGVLRRVDVVARLGGDEFAVLMPGAGTAESRGIVERLRACVPEPLSCSAGLTEWEGDEGSAEIMGRVDRALYMAKHAGRDRTVVLPPHDCATGKRD